MPAFPCRGGRPSHGQPARAPPGRWGGSRGDRGRARLPPGAQAAACRGVFTFPTTSSPRDSTPSAGVTSPRTYSSGNRLSLMKAAQRHRRYQTAGEPSRTKTALRRRHHPSPPRSVPAASSSPAAPCAGGLTLHRDGSPRRAPRRRHHPSPLRPAPAASSFNAAPCAGDLILHRCAPRQRHHPSLLRPAPAGLPPASPAASGRQALAASSCGRHLHRQRPAVHLQRPRPLDLIFTFIFIYVSHSSVLHRLLIQGPKV